MDRFDTFRIFLRVAEAESFTKAAAQLQVPRSTVSTAIQDLEGRVGMRLLHRTTRKVSLTVDGEAFLQRCIQLLDDLEETENLFRKGNATAGRLRVTLPTRIGHLVVAPALPRFLKMHPDIAIEVLSTDGFRDLIEDDIDCAIRVGVPRDDRLVLRNLGKLAIINCASPGYLQQHGTPRAPTDLQRHRMVQFLPSQTGRPEPWTFMQKGTEQTVHISAAVSTDNAETYIAAAVAGLGLIQIPAYDVKALLAAKRLVEVLPNARAASMQVSLLYPKRRHLSRRLQAFVDWIIPVLKSDLALAT